VTAHGGSCNAQTEGEYTSYEFDVSASFFEETLDIFAHCLLNPILSVSSSDRELHAIENEFQLAMTNDGARLQQLFCHFAKENHILRKFSWGNLESLRNKPVSLNLPVQDYLQGFHQRHYLPENCRLVVLAPNSLDSLEGAVLRSFSTWCVGANHSFENSDDKSGGETHKKRIRTANEGVTDIEPIKGSTLQNISLLSLTESCSPFINQRPLETSATSSITRIVPIETVHSLYLSWQLPATYCDYKSKSAQYLSHLIGHEGKGSLLSSLKNDLLGDSVCAGVSIDV
jgi:nardilysin